MKCGDLKIKKSSTGAAFEIKTSRNALQYWCLQHAKGIALSAHESFVSSANDYFYEVSA